VAVWYISPHFGILNKEKSGNTGAWLFPWLWLKSLQLISNSFSLIVRTFPGFSARAKSLKFSLKTFPFSQWQSSSVFFYSNPCVNRPGTDVMITIFCDFFQFSAKKLTKISETDFFHQNYLFDWFKNANLWPNFSAK
jgi:hypothetical protein